MANKRVTFALIGCGNIATSLADAIESIESASLTACADIDQDRARAVAKSYRLDRWYTDHENMLREANPDVAIIATPNGTHGDIAVDCAKAGVNVLCQKPLEITVGALDRMIGACDEHGVKLGGLYNLRAQVGSMATKHAVESGILGDIVLANGTVPLFRDADYYQGWHGSADLDGGTLFTHASHVIDRLAWLNNGIDRVFAEVNTVAHDIETEDVAAVTVRYGNGARGTITATTATRAYPHYDRIDLYGRAGYLTSTHEAIQSFATEARDELTYAYPYDGYGFSVLLRDMAQAVVEDREPMIPGRQARHAPDAIQAMHASAKRDEPVDVGSFLEEERGHPESKP